MTERTPRPKRARWLLPAVGGGLALLGLTALGLALMGRHLWCECGELFLWSGEIWSRHNSQHVADPYLFTHLMHGVLFYGLLFPLARWLEVRWRFLVAIGLECGWEVLENTDAVINRYRESTISLDYYGDSVVNSLFDVIACAAGFGFAAVVPVVASITTFAVTELALAWWIRDNLTLNVIMLVYPVEAVKAWQAGGAPTP